MPMRFPFLITDNNKTIILIRLIAGIVFLSEGIQKLILPEIRGAGRFAKIGLPNPDILGTFVGTVELVCGLLLIIGLCVRLASIPLIVIMLVAFAVTKSEVYRNDGFWELLHGSRTDWAMLLSCIFLLINGGGAWSVDRKLTATRTNGTEQP